MTIKHRMLETIKPGEVILPPERELRLWMRRHLAEKGLPETALYLTVSEIYEGNPDKRGRWLIVKSRQAAEWGNTHSRSFTFKARPHTSWPVIE
jgi:hypothetical protein